MDKRTSASIFNRLQFEKWGFGPHTANLVAKVANTVIDENSKVMTGNVFSSGKCDNFGTEYKPSDTHVLLAMNIEEIGSMPVVDEPLWKPEITQEDKLLALMEENDRLQKLVESKK